MGSSRPRSREAGQAAVEAALTLPLTVFLVLGTLQLFIMLQGRIMAEYAAFQAVRAGARNHGDCVPMMHAALAGLLPNVIPYMGSGTGGGSPGQKLARAWTDRIGSTTNPDPKYKSGIDGEHTGPIFWLARERPLTGDITGSQEDDNFDLPQDLNGAGGLRLEVRLVYWFALKIPFADWVISRMVLAYFGLEDYNSANPLMLAEKDANWTSASSPPPLDSLIRNELYDRVMNKKEYVFPIHATYGMRMMTPAKRIHFNTQNCPGTPNSL